MASTTRLNVVGSGSMKFKIVAVEVVAADRPLVLEHSNGTNEVPTYHHDCPPLAAPTKRCPAVCARHYTTLLPESRTAGNADCADEGQANEGRCGRFGVVLRVDDECCRSDLSSAG